MGKRIVIWCLGLGLSTGAALAVPPTIHVSWSEPGEPELGDDYIITTTDPDFPDIELVASSETWRIWSEDADNPGGVGDIGMISSPHPWNFGVKIEDDLGGDGARDVKGINLDPTNAANYSNLTGAKITGTLSGTTFLQRSNTGEGGNVTGAVTIDTIAKPVRIEGDVLAPMTVTTVSALVPGVVIVGTLGTPTQSADLDITTLDGPGQFRILGADTNYGDITVGTLMSGKLFVGGTVPSGKTVTIQNMENTGAFGNLIMGTLAGRLELMNGIPSSCPIPEFVSHPRSRMSTWF